MLTADLVQARRRGDELFVTRLSDQKRARALELAARLLDAYRKSKGRTRDELEDALAAIAVAPSEHRLFSGLSKLIDDGASWESQSHVNPEDARREVFGRAAQARAVLGEGARFDRQSVLTEGAKLLDCSAAELEQALFADLRAAAILHDVRLCSASDLVDAYDRAQDQAVLLRAVRVTVDVRCPSPAAARVLFRRLKFLGLLHTVHARDGGYQIVVDGPLSLFEAVTKYGQKMAQLLPLLESAGAFELEAGVLWGKDRKPATFRVRRSENKSPALEAGGPPDEIVSLCRAFSSLGTGWVVSEATVVLDLPGTGLCVPDLVFSRGNVNVYFELLGFWSREAVFRRVDLVRRGLSEKILFAVSSRLRVREDLLEDDASGALYVFKGTMSARSIAERLERLAAGGLA